MTMNKDRWLSLFYIAFGGVIIYLSSQIKTMFAVSSEDTGPKFFPYLCGIAMILCGIGKFISSRNRKGKPFVKNPKDWIRIAVISALLILYVIMLKYTGYIITSFALLMVLSIMLADQKKLKAWQVAIFSAAVVFAVYLLFCKVLKIALPQGLWIKALRKALR